MLDSTRSTTTTKRMLARHFEALFHEFSIGYLIMSHRYHGGVVDDVDDDDDGGGDRELLLLLLN